MHRVGKAACAAVLLALAAGAASAQSGPPPKVEVRLTPHAGAGGDSYMGVREVLSAPSLTAGQALVRLPSRMVGIPGAELLGEGLTAHDASGPLALTQDLEAPTPQGQYRRWTVGRATVGDVVVSYRAAPRKVTAATNNGPLFDLREEAGGFAGAGVTFLATPAKDQVYNFSLAWDLSQAPAQASGVSSFGDGDATFMGPADRLAFAFYAAGPLHSLPGKPQVNLYWLSPPPFAAEVLGARVKTLREAMSAFFGDPMTPYRVFVRQNPYAGTGGTALPQSFMFGYRLSDQPTLDSLQSLVSHEMAHGWPSMQGEHGDTAWYSEGAAEYYSMLLSYRAGILPLDQFVKDLNDKFAAYYTNPYLRLSNLEAGKIFWSDPTAQTVPYGRGLLYLIATDSAIRAQSGGKRSVDDIITEMYRRQKAGQPYAAATWLELVGREIGADQAKAAYEAMAAGQVLTPGGRFDGCLVATPKPMRVFDLGFSRGSLSSADRLIRDLKPGSQAAQAGLREGDQIIADKGMVEARKTETATLALTIKRDGAEQTLTFLPRGEAVDGLAWSKAPGADAARCKL
ncbi:hypothetical protein [Caulobacter sp. RHG1]|uniref:M61 family metallopeptidase n=1 Tax=Caulobacter sp. (strain RHG1) TaxID=2545762 RepID=UPI00155561E6|nr:hypothetical protein [Caulobacter sp. RHG1]NQE63440.1 hypothetical protein [Caulobacter sp. RHG1]